MFRSIPIQRPDEQYADFHFLSFRHFLRFSLPIVITWLDRKVVIGANRGPVVPTKLLRGFMVVLLMVFLLSSPLAGRSASGDGLAQSFQQPFQMRHAFA